VNITKQIPAGTCIIAAAMFFTFCSKSGSEQAPEKQAIKLSTAVDSVGSYKLNGGWLKARKSFEFNDSARFSGDTLYLVTCADFVYYPFGAIKNESELRRSLLKNFDAKTKVVSIEANYKSTFHSLRKGNNKLLLFFLNEDDEGWGSYIQKGILVDSSVALINGIKVGMPTSRFYSVFLTAMDAKLQRKVRFVVLEPCVDPNPRHVYSFGAGRLKTIRFDCASCGMDVAY
jgi:hypothetical protein